MEYIISVNTFCGAMSHHSCELIYKLLCVLKWPRATYRNVGYSHLPLLPTPNCVSYHSTQCCSLWRTNWI